MYHSRQRKTTAGKLDLLLCIMYIKFEITEGSARKIQILEKIQKKEVIP